MRTVFTTFVVVAFASLLSGLTARGADPFAGADPSWALLHEPAVVAELKLSSTQRVAYQELMDSVDLRFFPLRNKSREVVVAVVDEIMGECQQKLNTLLLPAQSKRFREILMRKLGTAALVRDDLDLQMDYTDEQLKQLKTIVDKAAAAVTALEKEASEGKPRQPLEEKFKDVKLKEQQEILALLKPAQRTKWQQAVGAPFDLSRLGQTAYRAPEIVDTKDWINSPAMKLADQRGKVVVLHFYAFGCSNCIHNYPWYREWHDKFQGKDVVLIGVHTPETAGEREAANVRSSATKEKFAFPVVIDGKSENWNAWGNSMWPSVYLIDKRGYLRHFWPGELKWQGLDGEKYMRERIEQLLTETDAKS
ncbi:Thiol-disulfide oxidoreductase YkuV [Anatilimnocola aggregata]|uniref:Thiol-disulfide oxidoreductase YkuV n=1 Tax=Anatilimnocola aggregata TaxID=2528021 RepID=A0A517Y566_9BACT|nr:redoxin domain-containing protein [Anatilimnocola aggregata]QDU25340.1 Thiol-disulfide oxidoreductase YkuV [Anatilimnocola aggregata]